MTGKVFMTWTLVIGVLVWLLVVVTMIGWYLS